MIIFRIAHKIDVNILSKIIIKRYFLFEIKYVGLQFQRNSTFFFKNIRQNAILSVSFFDEMSSFIQIIFRTTYLIQYLNHI